MSGSFSGLDSHSVLGQQIRPPSELTSRESFFTH